MAAASHVTPRVEVGGTVDASPAPAAMIGFLVAAGHLCRAVQTVHTDVDANAIPELAHASTKGTLAALSKRLSDAACHLLGQDYSTPVRSFDASGNDLLRPCCIVARDLLIHTERIEKYHAGPADEPLGQAELRVSWSSRDVEALGLRLHGLILQFKDAFPPLYNEELGTLVKQLVQEDMDEGDEGRYDNLYKAFSPAQANITKSRADANDGQDRVKRKDIVVPIVTKPNAVPSRPARTPAPASGLLHDFILESLAYKSMHDREEEVTRSHGDTFQWIFDGNHDDDEEEREEQKRPHFIKWLATDHLGPIYWITGKPGSGKSTLTHFLFQQPATVKCLRQWAGEREVAMAGFFFWTSGSREQRSQTGLLRSLLHQLLLDRPDFMPLAFPSLWGRLCTMSTKERIRLNLEWSVPELMAAFRAFVTAALPTMKICLFVDGLDEFEGNHLEIIHFFKELGMGTGSSGGSGGIKMCLSSRPWAVFQSAFEHDVPNLRLQDLTYSDMYQYARDRLRGDRDVRRLLDRDAVAEGALIRKTVERANGVFLWVRLAANEMLDRFQTGNGLDQLEAIAHLLPSDLDELFVQLLFEEQAASEIADTATLFLLIRAREIVADFVKDDSSNSLKLWELAFSLRAGDDDHLALSAGVEEVPDELVRERCSWTAKFVKQRFAGLLDFHGRRRDSNLRELGVMGDGGDDGDGMAQAADELAENRVTYIHRTVRDWLMEGEGIFDRLVTKAPAEFDAHLRLLRSFVLRLKHSLEEIEHHRRLDDWWSDIALAMTHARYTQKDPEDLQRPLLNEMSSTISWYWSSKPKDPYDHWARSAFGAYEVRMKAAPIWQPFLCLATKFGLTTYVAQELEARIKAEETPPDGAAVEQSQLDLEADDATPLLAYATEFLCSRNKTIFPLSSPALVRHLLRHPSRLNRGPNHAYADFTTRKPRTTWTALLRHLRDARRRGWIAYYDTDSEGTARWAEVVRMFVEEGCADAGAVVAADQWDGEVDAVGVMEMLEETYGAEEMRGLKELVMRKRDEGRGGA